MSKKAKQYSPQEKAKVAMEAIKGDLTMAQISSQYGVHATQINRWKRGAIEALRLAGVGRIRETACNKANKLQGRVFGKQNTQQHSAIKLAKKRQALNRLGTIAFEPQPAR